MLYRKTLLLGLLAANSLNLFAQQNPGSKHEIGIAPFAVEWNNETLNEPIAPKGVYRMFYNRHLDKWSWTNSLGYGENNINDKNEECFDCFYGTGRMEELVFTSGWRWHFPAKRPIRIKGYLEAGAYFSNYRYRGDFDGGFTGQGVVLDLNSETLGAYGELGMTYSPVPRLSFYASTKYKGGKDFFGERKVKTFGLTILQVGLGFFPFK